MKRTAMTLLLVLGLTSCTTEPSPATAGPTVLSLSDDVPALTAGEDYDVVARVPAQLDGRAASLAGWTADGTEIYERYAHSADGDPKDRDPYAVALVARDPKTHRTTVISDRAKRQGPVALDRIPGNALEIVSTVVADDLVVWIEASNLTHGDLYAHDMGSGVERRLVRSTALASGATPVVRDGVVYFVGVEGDDLDATPPHTSLYRVPVDGSAEPELVAPGASEVFADRSPIPSGTGDVIRVAFADRVVDWDPERGTDGEVDGTGLPADCGASAGEGITVACAGSPEKLTIDTGDRRFVVEDTSGTFAWPRANGRWVMFTVDDDGDQTQYVFDVEREKLLRVPTTRNLRGLHTDSYFLAVLGSWDPDPIEPVIEFAR